MLRDFLISFLEIVILKGCLGGIRQNSIFRNDFEIRDVFQHWLLRDKRMWVAHSIENCRRFNLATGLVFI